jgi:hypothetical protein
MSCKISSIPAEEVITFMNGISPLIGRAKVLADASQYLDGEPDALPCCIAIMETISELMGRADEELDRLSERLTRATADD